MSDYYFNYTEDFAGREIHYYTDLENDCIFAVSGDKSDSNVTRAMHANRAHLEAVKQSRFVALKAAGLMPSRSFVAALFFALMAVTALAKPTPQATPPQNIATGTLVEISFLPDGRTHTTTWRLIDGGRRWECTTQVQGQPRLRFVFEMPKLR